MLNASESATAAAAATAATTTRQETGDPDLFAKELGSKMAQTADRIAASLEKMAAAFPGVTISAKAVSTEYTVKTGSNSSINLSPETMARMAEDDALFEKVRELVSSLFEAGDNQRLVNAGGTATQRNVTIQEGEIRYVEVQRGPNGTTLSVSALSLENEQLINETLDKLFANRNNSTTTGNASRGFESIIGGSDAWRLQSFVASGSVERVTSSWNGSFSSASGQWLQANQSFTANLEVVIQQWETSGTRVDLMSYIEIMGLSDPIVLDLGGDGINLRSAEDGVYFDIKGDGSPVRTAFVQGNDAFLYLDENGNGVADDASELFGDHGGYANGFEKLARYDDNGDGVIDENDAIYHQLRVWQDRNGDGVNQADESMTLAQAGIASLNLNYAKKQELDSHGNVIGERSSFTRTDGTTGLMADVWLRNG